MSEKLDTEIGTPALDHAVRMAGELHHLPAGPLDMYARMDLTRKPFTGPKKIQPQDMDPQYSILYFPDHNSSSNEFYETLSVIRHYPEEADETKKFLRKAATARLGQWAIDKHDEERPIYQYFGPMYGTRKVSEKLNIPYAAVIFSRIPKLSPSATIAQLHIPARVSSERALFNFQKAIKNAQGDEIHTYEANADSVARVIC